MTRRVGAIEVEIGEDAFRVRAWSRCVTIPFAPCEDAEEEADVVVGLDEIEHWDPPDAEIPISLEELGKILDAIERECDKRGLIVAFE